MTDDFDFWLGTWTVRWGAAEHETGRNVITRGFGDHVVEERFSADEPETLRGLSVSVFDAQDACWKQTWVDDNGSYPDFRGGFDGEAMVLSRQLPRRRRDRHAANGVAGHRGRPLPVGVAARAGRRGLGDAGAIAYERPRNPPGPVASHRAGTC
jgi:hypothetical protein